MSLNKNTKQLQQTVKQFAEHPTVKNYLSDSSASNNRPTSLNTAWLRELCLELGADDVGFIPIESQELGAEKDKILECFPHTKSLVSLVCKMNRDDVRNPARSIANNEFHHAGHDVDDIARRIVRQLEDHGIRAINVTMGFPMEIHKFPERIWLIAHKIVAEAAGTGKMGIHRNVIHPKFGNFILLGTILLDTPLTSYTKPIDYNPCLSCKLCVAACPVGAIAPDGYFNGSACLTHNYREFLGGFQNWVDNVIESKTPEDFREKVSLGENVSMWQSLSFGANYKAAYCMATCPAGEDVIAPFLERRQDFVKEVLKPLQDKRETIYVVPGSDAESYVQKRFPHKTVKRVHNGITPQSINGFLTGMRRIFQPEQAKGLDVTYQFKFTGKERREAIVTIKNQRVSVTDGVADKANLIVTADSAAWLKFLSNRTYLPLALLTGKIKLKGSPKLLLMFGKCFVS